MRTLTENVLFGRGLLVGRRPDGRPVRPADSRPGDDVDAVALEWTDPAELADVLGAVAGDLAAAGASESLVLITYTTEELLREAADTFGLELFRPEGDPARRWTTLLMQTLTMTAEMLRDDPMRPPPTWPFATADTRWALVLPLELAWRAMHAALTGDPSVRWLPTDPDFWHAVVPA